MNNKSSHLQECHHLVPLVQTKLIGNDTQLVNIKQTEDSKDDRSGYLPLFPSKIQLGMDHVTAFLFLRRFTN